MDNTVLRCEPVRIRAGFYQCLGCGYQNKRSTNRPFVRICPQRWPGLPIRLRDASWQRLAMKYHATNVCGAGADSRCEYLEFDLLCTACGCKQPKRVDQLAKCPKPSARRVVVAELRIFPDA
jgi:hypothetical protein